jgi:hypothetical protein
VTHPHPHPHPHTRTHTRTHAHTHHHRICCTCLHLRNVTIVTTTSNHQYLHHLRYTAALLLLSTIGTLHPSIQSQTLSHTHEQSLFSYTLQCSTSFQTRSGSSRSLGTATATTTTSSRCVVPCRFLHCFQLLALLPTSCTASNFLHCFQPTLLLKSLAKTADLRKHCYLLMMLWEVILLATLGQEALSGDAAAW